MQYLEGILKIANLFLAIVAGIIGISLFRALHKNRRKKQEQKVWRFLIVALVFFAIQMILGALRAFNIFESPFLTHIVPTVILAFLIVALVIRINISKND